MFYFSGDVEDEGENETADEKPVGGLSKGDRSHLIVWYVTVPCNSSRYYIVVSCIWLSCLESFNITHLC